MKKIKIAYIGGGSKQWARVFMNDLALQKKFTGEIALYDIDYEAMVRNKDIGNRINSHPNCQNTWNYSVNKDIDDALLGADFVIISILPGTFEEMRVDVHLPEKYGIFQSVGDTSGPGGILRAMRTVPIYESFAKHIEKSCPKAWVLNLTNPMSICVQTLYDVFPAIKAFGCCHEVFHTQDLLCAVLKEEKNMDVTRKDIFTDVSGINHFTWFSKAKYKDIDIFPLLENFMKKHKEEGFYEHGTPTDFLTNTFAYANKVKFDLYDRYHVLAAAGDRHLVEFMNNDWYIKDPTMVHQFGYALTTVDFRIQQMQDRIQESKEFATGQKEIPLKRSDEEVVDLISALMGNSVITSNVNLPNNGQVSFLPKQSIVETNAVFSNDCVTPLVSDSLPIPVQNLIIRNSLNINTCYEGIKKRDLNILFSCFMNQPLCSTLTIDEGRQLFNEMVEGTKECLAPYFSL